MRWISKALAAAALAATLNAVPIARASYAPLMANDYRGTVIYPRPIPNDRTWVYGGDRTPDITNVNLNPFPNPQTPTASYDPVANLTSLEFRGDQFPTTGVFETFGAEMNTRLVSGTVTRIDPRISRWYYTYNGIIIGKSPAVDQSYTYDSSTQQAQLTLSNLSDDTISLFSVGYVVRNTPITLDHLNRTDNGPGAFLPSGVIDGTQLLPGDSVSFTLSGILATDFVTLFADAKYSGSSSGNDYIDVSGSWAEFSAVPEPSSVAMLCVGGVLLSIRIRRSTRARGWSS
jgi:hypothetical protein